MAGLGFKDFQVGEVLTSADVDGYLMQQSVMRFADSAARGSALGTASGTGVALAEGMVSYLDDVNQVQVYDGTFWRLAGAVLQIVQTVKTDTFSTTSTSYVDVTGLSVTITPSSTASKVLLIASLHVGSFGHMHIQITGGNSNTYIGDSAGSRVRASASQSGRNASSYAVDNDQFEKTIVYLDSPSTTSATTYKLQAQSNVDGGTVGRTRADTDSASFARTPSSITAIEVSL